MTNGLGTGDAAAPDFLSYWVKSAQRAEYPALASDLTCDVAVVGAGIIGVTTALKLRREGASVALLEARRIGSGATGYTTAKLSSLQGTIYGQLSAKYDDEVARAYAQVNESGLELAASYVELLGIDCDFRRKPNFTYSVDDAGRLRMLDEAGAAKRAGLGASFVAEADELPFPVTGAVRVANQAEFHPLDYLDYLDALVASAAESGAHVHERSRVVSVDQGDPCRLGLESGATVTAGHVILATHLPIADRGAFFARTHAERSYVLMARLRGAVPQGMYLSDESPAHSLRSVPTPEGELLMVGGESHKAGQADESERYRRLEEWARERFDVSSVEHHWATQDHIPHDKLPFIGRVWPFSRRVLTATGMRKWGLAMGTSAAAILADRVLGRENEWAEAFEPVRAHPIAAGPSFLKQNADDGFRFFADRVRNRGSAADLGPGEGAVVGAGASQRAVYRDEAGDLHSLSARCTHLGCIVAFNNAERTWDCPCHGSRFGLDGEVLEGPAVRGLPPAG